MRAKAILSTKRTRRRKIRILLLADLHSAPKVLDALDKFISKSKFDLCLVAGDITVPGQKEETYTKKLIRIFKKQGIRILCVFGNNDTQKTIDVLEKEKINLHYGCIRMGEYNICGVGGTGEEIGSIPRNTKRFQVKGSILVTHVCPKITPRKLPDAPLVHICGHSHFISSAKENPSTKLIRLRAAFWGDAAVLELPSKKVTFMRLLKK